MRQALEETIRLPALSDLFALQDVSGDCSRLAGFEPDMEVVGFVMLVY